MACYSQPDRRGWLAFIGTALLFLLRNVALAPGGHGDNFNLNLGQVSPWTISNATLGAAPTMLPAIAFDNKTAPSSTPPAIAQLSLTTIPPTTLRMSPAAVTWSTALPVVRTVLSHSFSTSPSPTPRGRRPAYAQSHVYPEDGDIARQLWSQDYADLQQGIEDSLQTHPPPRDHVAVALPPPNPRAVNTDVSWAEDSRGRDSEATIQRSTGFTHDQFGAPRGPGSYSTSRHEPTFESDHLPLAGNAQAPSHSASYNNLPAQPYGSLYGSRMHHQTQPQLIPNQPVIRQHLAPGSQANLGPGGFGTQGAFQQGPLITNPRRHMAQASNGMTPALPVGNNNTPGLRDHYDDQRLLNSMPLHPGQGYVNGLVYTPSQMANVARIRSELHQHDPNPAPWMPTRPFGHAGGQTNNIQAQQAFQPAPYMLPSGNAAVNPPQRPGFGYPAAHQAVQPRPASGMHGRIGYNPPQGGMAIPQHHDPHAPTNLARSGARSPHISNDPGPRQPLRIVVTRTQVQLLQSQFPVGLRVHRPAPADSRSTRLYRGVLTRDQVRRLRAHFHLTIGGRDAHGDHAIQIVPRRGRNVLPQAQAAPLPQAGSVLPQGQAAPLTQAANMPPLAEGAPFPQVNPPHVLPRPARSRVSASHQIPPAWSSAWGMNLEAQFNNANSAAGRRAVLRNAVNEMSRFLDAEEAIERSLP